MIDVEAIKRRFSEVSYFHGEREALVVDFSTLPIAHPCSACEAEPGQRCRNSKLIPSDVLALIAELEKVEERVRVAGMERDAATARESQTWDDFGRADARAKAAVIRAEMSEAALQAAVNAGWRASLKLGQVAEALKASLAREADLRSKLAAVNAHEGDVWFWQGDGRDDPESLTCPVIMRAETLREFVKAKEESNELRATNAILHRRTQRLEGIEARLARVREGYERLVAYLYRDRTRERYGARKRFRVVYDVLKAAGYPWSTPHPTRKNAWDGEPAFAEAHELIGMLAQERDALRKALDLEPLQKLSGYSRGELEYVALNWKHRALAAWEALQLGPCEWDAETLKNAVDALRARAEKAEKERDALRVTDVEYDGAAWDRTAKTEEWASFRGPDFYLPRIDVMIFERAEDTRPEYRRRAQRVTVTDGGVVGVYEWYTPGDPPTWQAAEEVKPLPRWDAGAAITVLEAVFSIFQWMAVGTINFPRAVAEEESDP